MNHAIDRTKADILPFVVVAIVAAVGAAQLALTIVHAVAKIALR